jgi:two-component system OmpR family sensor kinase
MQLARAEGGRLQAAEPTDIAPILRLLVDEMAEDAKATGRIDLDLPYAPVLSHIDVDAFAILARNLIENALKHSAPEEPVSVTLSADGVLHVANAGPVVPPELLVRLSEPYERGHTQAGGTGLGLAIAKAIAAGTGGTIVLTSPRPGRDEGFEANFRIGGTT